MLNKVKESKVVVWVDENKNKILVGAAGVVLTVVSFKFGRGLQGIADYLEIQDLVGRGFMKCINPDTLEEISLTEMAHLVRSK